MQPNQLAGGSEERPVRGELASKQPQLFESLAAQDSELEMLGQLVTNLVERLVPVSVSLPLNDSQKDPDARPVNSLIVERVNRNNTTITSLRISLASAIDALQI